MQRAEKPTPELRLVLSHDSDNGEVNECSLEDPVDQFLSLAPVGSRSECNGKYGLSATSASFCPFSQRSTSQVDQSHLNTMALTPYKVNKLPFVSR
ncbi:hypothetical protein T265_11529 [Opisthorchis viverrini]|uniref:Uncharacterized protein n=1 Tax=Opisthorchis viverrini TaxID=6198 RepID=A0A074YYP4_OPIVI|nr:hypothetical protein T265_11529 [Opisthorchis viverrini]KER19778.1 hypothetical protein T265_11529 [Opisthorchis viverrini]